MLVSAPPRDVKLSKSEGLTIVWADGGTSFYPIDYLRRMSPSADNRHLREQLEENPLMVLPKDVSAGPVTAVDAQLMGAYAIKLSFSDGHDTGIYSWDYLREIDPDRP